MTGLFQDDFFGELASSALSVRNSDGEKMNH
jgi:hypothetical protein